MHGAMRLVVAAPLSRKRLAFCIPAPNKRCRYPRARRAHAARRVVPDLLVSGLELGPHAECVEVAARARRA
jgi:hypothetical protein